MLTMLPGLLLSSVAVFPDPPGAQATITVGPSEGDLRGSDQRVIQAAIDYVANLGGGTVVLLPGRYELFDSVHLRSHVNLIGQGEGVVLHLGDGFEVPLTTDGDYGEAQVSVAEPERWRVGMGISVGDDQTHGFLVTVGTVVAIDGHDLKLNTRIHGGDLLVTRKAWARAAFPPVSGVEVEDVRVEHLTVEGNQTHNPPVNGCVGAGIYTFRSRNVTIADCTVRDYNGDGISFQTSYDVTVEDCEVSGCAGLGLHPGSGSQRPTITGCHSHHNQGIGLFVCWRVRGGRFIGNLVEDNGGHGISIGHKDTDNLFEANTLRGNGGHGVLFRNEPEYLAAHRNVFRGNVIEDNGLKVEDGCGIRVEGATADLTFDGNTVRAGARQQTAVWLGPEAGRVTLSDNKLEGYGDGAVVDRREAAGQ